MTRNETTEQPVAGLLAAQRYGLVGRVIERANDLVPTGAEGA
jgi:hypothetical protein